MEKILDLNDGFRDTCCSVIMQWIPGKSAICDESERAMVRPSSSRTYSLGDTIVGISNEISACSLNCQTSTHVDNQLKTVKTKPVVGHLDYHGPGENLPTYRQPAVSGNVMNVSSIKAKDLITSSLNNKHTTILDTTLQENQISIGLGTTSQEYQESNGLGTTLEGNKESNHTDDYFSTSGIKSRIIGQKRVCWSGNICSTSTPAAKNESIEGNCNGCQDNLNKSSSLSSLPEYATLISAASGCSNESGSSRTFNFVGLHSPFGSSKICAPTLKPPAPVKRSAVSRTLSATPFGKTDSLNILHTAENLNSLELSTSIRKIKTEPFELAIEHSGKNSLESTFISKTKNEPFVPTTESSQNKENTASNFGMFMADIKVEEIDEDLLDHLSLEDRINRLLVSQPHSFIRQQATANFGMFKADIKVKENNEDLLDHLSLEDRFNRLLVSQPHSFIRQPATASNFGMFRADIEVEEIDEDLLDHLSLEDRINRLLVSQPHSFIRQPATASNFGMFKVDIKVKEIDEDLLDHLSLEDRINRLLVSQPHSFIRQPATASNFGMFTADIKVKEIDEDLLDHLSLEDRINRLLVSQPHSFIRQPAVSEKVVHIGSQRCSVTTKCSITLSANQEHNSVLDTNLQENQVSPGLDMTLQENQESSGLETTSRGNQESSGTYNHSSTSEIKSSIIGQKCTHWKESDSGNISSPTLTVAVKNESIEESWNCLQDNFDKSHSLSYWPEYASLTSAASVCSNVSGSSRACTLAELQENLPSHEKKSYISRTLLDTPGKSKSLSSLHNAEILNSSESSTSIRKVKIEPMEPTIEPFGKNSLESSTFIRRDKTKPFEPATEPSENRENSVSHLDMLMADIKVEEINEYPLDHISLKDRINKLLVSQPYHFLQRTAENFNQMNKPTLTTDAKSELYEPTMETSENRACNGYNSDLLRANVKSEKIEELPLDAMDDILLKDRLNMLLIRQGSFQYHTISKDSKANVPSTMSIATTAVTATKMAMSSTHRRKRRRTATDSVATALGEDTNKMATSSTHRRKRKRTATDSVATALGEDAPELLQALVDQGLNIEELKLYEVMDGYDDLIDISDIEDNFTDLGNVISKLFFVRSNSLLNLNSLRDMEGLKASYSLSCLISLIQQAQYLQLRKCPVEWGWCRDLQSFIFVFEKHNRIVLERPEYGYATYFFELIESFPIDWQIKRLIITMKLTNCSRIALIENKSLMVGQDMTEGEARVLQDYGWRPHTGLASMLNFCDRVVHDRRSEMNLSEWKSKIGNLLMSGYDSGRTVIHDLPRKVVQYMENQCSKMEIGTEDFVPDF